MFKRFLPCFILLLFVFAVGLTYAQVQQQLNAQTESSSNPFWVTASAAGEQVRFSALGLVQRMRLEVLDQAGGRVYDSDFQDGSLLDWRVTGQAGHRLPDGLYACQVTAVDFAGQSSYRRGAFWVTNGTVAFEALEGQGSATALRVDRQDSIAILRESGDRAITQLAHDGDMGRIVSGKGGLSFRVGDMLTGKDVEYLRLTADGRLGLGVEEPAAKLDVEGLIRTSEGIVFPDGTIQRTAASINLFSPAGAGRPVFVPAEGSKAMKGVPSLSGTDLPRQTMTQTDGIGQFNATEEANRTFFGLAAGYTILNLGGTGGSNAFFGNGAGYSTSSGNGNSFFGQGSGYSATTGSLNSFFGNNSGYNTTGNANSFFGYYAGNANTSGEQNAFFGHQAGLNSTEGSYNVFIGRHSGYATTVESNNTFVGAYSDGLAGITNATAIGYRAQATQSNSLILGSINGVNGAAADTSVGIGTTSTSPVIRLLVESSYPNPTAGSRSITSNTYFAPTANNNGYVFGLESSARYSGTYNLTTTYTNPAYALAALMGYYGGTVASGTGSVAAVTGVSAQNIVRSGITVNHAMGVQIQPATADVGSATVSNTYGVYVKNPYNVTPTNVYGLYTENFTAGTNNYGVYVAGTSKSYFGGRVGIGTNAPSEALHVVGNAYLTGTLTQNSDARLKQDVRDLGYGLHEVLQLRPVSWQWKDRPKERFSMGLIAQEVDPVIPELVLKNSDQAGTMSLNYIGLVPVLVKAIQEQQTALERKDAEIQSLSARLAALEQMMAQFGQQVASQAK